MFQHFYHGTLTKVTQAVGSLFNRIYVVRYEAGIEKERILVPLNYANRHTYIARLENQPALEDQVFVEATFPRMSYEMTSLSYDPSRKLNTIHKHVASETNDFSKNAAYQSVPYNLTYALTIVAKHMVDANQILEQILPYFTPSYTIAINSIPSMGYQENIQFELTGVDFSDNYQQEFDEQRQIQYVLSFVARCQFHGPTHKSKLIKKVQVDVSTPRDFSSETLSNTPRSARLDVETDPPDAEPGDTFGYLETWTEFMDGKKYNPVTDSDEDV